jgi:hypothetical protein
MRKICIVCKKRKEIKGKNNICDDCKQELYRNQLIKKQDGNTNKK